MPKSIGIISQRFAQPLFSGLRRGDNPLFELNEESSTQLAIKLREKNLDGAFLSPIDYAKNYSAYKVVPDVAAISKCASNTILLFFKENIRKLETFAFDPNFSSEIVLATIILSEKFDSKPKLIPFTGDIDSALNEADAFLAVGDTAMKLQSKRNRIDLVDEWLDISELPFVHGMWVAREDNLTEEEIAFLIASSENILKGNKNDDEASDTDQGGFSYKLTEEAIAGLTEFFRMAYYHGILKDIPDVKFFLYKS